MPAPLRRRTEDATGWNYRPTALFLTGPADLVLTNPISRTFLI
jgi:hypothetical protein